MCKLFAIVEIENKKNAEMFAKKAIPFITKTDNDGLGIMRLGENGVHIQRWLDPNTVGRSKSPYLEKYMSALNHQENQEGRKSNSLYAIAIHGRLATCEKSLENTHPFYRQGSALMHNGIINNPLHFTRILSSCDSEALLSQYIEKNVVADEQNLTKAMEGISGYYAAVTFNDNGVIDIWRDNNATLFLAHVANVGIVIATTADIIIKTAQKCREHITGIDEVLAYSHIRWINGKLHGVYEFEAIKPIVFDSVKPDCYPDSEKWWHTNDKKLTEDELIDRMKLRRLQGAKDNPYETI